jgi:hypothetical protein
MSTRIVFGSGGELVVAETEDDVVHAIRRDYPNPVTLESSTGAQLHINWNHVAYVEEALTAPSEVG